MHPQVQRARARQLSDLRHGARTDDAGWRRRGQSRAARHDAAVLGMRRVVGPARRPGDGRGFREARSHRVARRGMGAACARHAGGAVGRLALLRARLEVDRQPAPQHVHADRARHRGRLCLQSRCGADARHISAFVPHTGRRGPGLFRAGGRHRDPGAARPGPRAARPHANRYGHPRAVGSRAHARPPGARRRHRNRHPARRGPAGKPPAGSSRREGAGRRRRARRKERGRRVDDHRRTRAGGEGPGRQGYRRYRQCHRHLRHARGAGRQRHLACPDRPDGRRGAALARADPRPWPIPFPAGSCRASSLPPC